MNYCSFLLVGLLEILPGSVSDRYFTQIFIQLSFNCQLCVSAVSAVGPRPSVCLSECHCGVLYGNGCRCHQTFSRTYSPIILVSSSRLLLPYSKGNPVCIGIYVGVQWKNLATFGQYLVISWKQCKMGQWLAWDGNRMSIYLCR